MKRRAAGLVLTLVLGALVAPLADHAQQAAPVPRIGVLRPGLPLDPYVEAFRQGLRDLDRHPFGHPKAMDQMEDALMAKLM